ncbi:PEP-CTERM sorting domain-containing protein [Rugamonas sp. DEMB1]|uniref:PEP-CTERM sorting domain-containing protein n=1 Tax=Rugamonas sp. DEMB1 TaxID=3039386 RepID=UPI00244BE764|nr:PEP-CTERM sorting domain-containing protein [Rugamonas sp. DEMB1]WGG49696.1 PEP-CTERM sorting domain-containing protein [Rugamonas sp. DEMB1]
MKKIAGLICGLAMMEAAQADVVTYEFTATITTMKLDYTVVTESSLPGKTISVGEAVRGRLTYNTQTPLHSQWIGEPGEPGTARNYAARGMKNTMSFVFETHGFSFDSAPSTSKDDQMDITVRNDTDAPMGAPGPYDQLNIEAYSVNSYGRNFGSLSMNDYTGSLLVHGDIPHRLPDINSKYILQEFEYNLDHNGVWLSARGALTSLTLVSSVPEPSTYAMFMAGLACLAWRRRTRR